MGLIPQERSVVNCRRYLACMPTRGNVKQRSSPRVRSAYRCIIARYTPYICQRTTKDRTGQELPDCVEVVDSILPCACQDWHCKEGAVLKNNNDLPWSSLGLNELQMAREGKINSKSCLAQAQIWNNPCTAPSTWPIFHSASQSRSDSRLVTHRCSVLLPFGAVCGCYLDNASSVLHSPQSAVHHKADSLGSAHVCLKVFCGQFWVTKSTFT